MIVHLGLYFDGMQPGPPVTSAGEIALGPARFVAVLELQLGLPAVAARPGEALLAYRRCLAELDGEDRFYHRSFAVDSLGTARTLLRWRRLWHEAGWRGGFEGGVTRRLADMAELERIAAARVPLDAGQRLQRILEALDAGLTAQIENIVLHDELDAFPPAWRAVLERFELDRPEAEARTRDRPIASAPGSDLHRLQQRLLAVSAAEGAAPERIELSGDDSFIVVRAVSRDLSAQAVAEYLRKLGRPNECVVIAEKDGIIVDNALERVGLPRAGFQHHSPFRAVTQVLKLCLGLVWEPVSAKLLLQFLLHPVGPLPSFVRSALAEAVAAEPGVGGRAWREAVRAAGERLRRRADEERRPELAAEADVLEADIRYWLESERHPPSPGAPPAVLIDRAQRCTAWLTRRLNAGLSAGTQRELYAAAMAQGEALIAVLADLARQTDGPIERITLERLLDEVTRAAPDPATFAEAGHTRATTEPGAVTHPWPTVIWWDLCEQVPPSTPAFSRAEIAELAAQQVSLPSPAERIRAQSRAWRRPILNAREQAILVVHDREEGRHPLLIQLESLARGFNEARVEDALLAPHAIERPSGAEREAEIAALAVPTEPLAPRRLPGRRRSWQLPSDRRLAPREQESYSSLQKLIHYPHEWVLEYAARLRSGRAAGLARGGLLHGKLAHRLFETYFGEHPDRASRKREQLTPWVSATLPGLIRSEGAVLMEPGMGVTREAVARTLGYALEQLLRHLEAAGIEQVAAETRHEAAFMPFPHEEARRDVRLCGVIDLLLTDRRGREIVVDVKWGGEDRRGAELERNRALQLATYAYMRRFAGGKARRPDPGVRGDGPIPLELPLEHSPHWPAQAYFIVTTGNMLARDTNVFPDAVVFGPEVPETSAELWARVVRSVEWRWAQLSTGFIEVNAEGTEPVLHCLPPEDALAPAPEPDTFDEFTWLTGWEEGI